MDKKAKFSIKTSAGIALMFSGIIVASEVNLIVGIAMIGIGIFLVAND